MHKPRRISTWTQTAPQLHAHTCTCTQRLLMASGYICLHLCCCCVAFRVVGLTASPQCFVFLPEVKDGRKVCSGSLKRDRTKTRPSPPPPRARKSELRARLLFHARVFIMNLGCAKDNRGPCFKHQEVFYTRVCAAQ